MNEFLAQATSSTAHLRDDERLVDVSLVIEQRIFEGDELIACYHLVLGDGRVEVIEGPAEAPDVTLEQDSSTAHDLRNGDLHGQHALLTGRLSVRGDVQKLVAHGSLLGELLGGARA